MTTPGLRPCQGDCDVIDHPAYGILQTSGTSSRADRRWLQQSVYRMFEERQDAKSKIRHDLDNALIAKSLLQIGRLGWNRR